MVVNEVTTKL